ncbi:MAG: hypothetical protein K2J20_06015, partial [Bacilli bacterium]|nr:hypothetical protein [Bacilli bacterium]
ILDSVDALYKYVLDKKRAQVVAITGSVGKTTAVGVITDVLKSKYNVLRVYSKRITPIILKANLINFLTEDIDYIVLEMSIYHKDHVEILSDLLNPDISALINIDSSHLEFFDSIDDICINKASIFRHAKVGFYNNLDEYAKNLSLEAGELCYKGELIHKTKMEKLLEIATDYEVNDDRLIFDNQEIKLFYASELTMVQMILAYKIGVLAEVPKHSIVEALNNYQPVENRIQKKMAFGKEIIFDGDVTTNERIRQLANNNYEKCYLVIRKFGSMENNKRFEKVLDYLERFTKVFIFQDIEYKEMLKKHPKVEVVKNHNFINTLDGVIIYHYSGYYRSFEEYDEENLINLENEKYKIMKPEDI